MNIMLIYPRPDIRKNTRFGFSYDLLTIATILEPYHQVIIHDYSCENYNSTLLMNQAKEESIDLLILECDSFALKRSQNINHAKEIISLFKGHIPIIAYGNYCYIKEQDFSRADYTIKVNDYNVLISKINDIDKNIQIPLISKYDSLPYINRELLLSINYYKQNRYSTLLQTSKGCENSCIFCQRKGWQKHYFAHSDDYVLGELKRIQNHGYKNVWVIDENFTFNLPRAKRILRKANMNGLTDGLNLFISSWANIDQEFIDLAACNNIRIISFGIESGSQDIIDFYRKNIKLENIPELIKYTNSKGIFTVGNFILGAPMESEETIEKTFSLIRRCEFDHVNIKHLTI